jgi:hypothetical protein
MLYLAGAMLSPARHRISILLLLAYAAGSILTEATHRDAADVLLHSRPVFEQHECGAKEIHVAFEDARHCLACSHFAQRFAIEALLVSIATSEISVLPFHALRVAQPCTHDILHSGKRGPPAPIV